MQFLIHFWHLAIYNKWINSSTKSHATSLTLIFVKSHHHQNLLSSLKVSGKVIFKIYKNNHDQMKKKTAKVNALSHLWENKIKEQ